MGAITDAWHAFKGVCKTTWQETRDMFVFDSGIDLEYKGSAKYSEGGLVNDTLPKDYDQEEVRMIMKKVMVDKTLDPHTSLELLEEIIKRQSKESKLKE